MELTTGIAINEFISARENEIKVMEKNLKEGNQFKGPHVPWQRLPRFMRRRAAAHDPKRLPRKMRAFAMKSFASMETKKPKSNRRKRRKNSDFGRRQKDKKWMETHVWHAKRMKMVILWGYKIPFTPNLKSTKALYRANAKYAALYDSSYFASVFLTGKFMDVADYLNTFIDPLDPIKNQAGGSRMLFSEFPAVKIGPVSFFWNENKCWLSVHPCILNEILELFQSHPSLDVNVESSDEYARFELTGPQSLQILKGSLDLVDNQHIWENLEEFPANGMSEFIVYDPRLTYPKKRIKSRTCAVVSTEKIGLEDFDGNATSFMIWDLDKLKEIENSKISEAVLNERRSKNLIPGSPLTPELSDARIPVLILERSQSIPSKIGSEKSSNTVSSGLDIIVHRAWAREFWRAFIYGGGKAEGLKERRSSYFEAGIPCFPYDYPETKAYHELASMVENEEQESYSRRPLNKRMNFEKAGIKSPFRIPFDDLTNGLPLIVLDQPSILKELDNFIQIDSFCFLENPCDSFIEYIARIHPIMAKYITEKTSDACMVRVRLLTLGKGSPQDRAIIYHSTEDMYRFWTETPEKDIPNESNHPLLDNFPDYTKTVGFVTTGGLSFTLGNGSAIGILSLSRLLNIFKTSALEKRKHKNFVLIRNIKGRIAWPATFEFIPNSI